MDSVKTNLENGEKTNEDTFAHKSKDYDKEASRTMRSTAIADAIIKAIPMETSMHIMDFGAGTGLLTKNLASHVGKITVVDTSPSMLEIFRTKQYECETAILQQDLLANDSALNGISLDGVVSALTMHHIQDIPGLFAKLFQWIQPGGFIALADLDKEDGSFHNAVGHDGVFHNGFERDKLQEMAVNTGFTNIQFVTADILKRDNGDFPIFLLTAKRP